MGTNLVSTGLDTDVPLREYTTHGSHQGSRINLGFFGSGGPYLHIKTNCPHQGHQMLKFEYDGYTYSGLNVHNSVTLYTYGPSSSPHDPSLINWGETTGGIVNYYYSSDSPDYLVIVLQMNASYTGGFLYCQSGKSHQNHSVDVLAYTASSSTTGAY
jgi:hypothetical protein